MTFWDKLEPCQAPDTSGMAFTGSEKLTLERRAVVLMIDDSDEATLVAKWEGALRALTHLSRTYDLTGTIVAVYVFSRTTRIIWCKKLEGDYAKQLVGLVNIIPKIHRPEFAGSSLVAALGRVSYDMKFILRESYDQGVVLILATDGLTREAEMAISSCACLSKSFLHLRCRK